MINKLRHWYEYKGKKCHKVITCNNNLLSRCVFSLCFNSDHIFKTAMVASLSSWQNSASPNFVIVYIVKLQPMHITVKGTTIYVIQPEE